MTRRAGAAVLTFGLAALLGEWVVHQLAYLIAYGSRFDAVMASTPHRYYMAPAGALLAIAVLLLLSLAALLLRLDALRRQRWVALLPPRLRRFIPPLHVRVPLSAVGLTAAGLACWQVAVYLLQENLETVAVGGGLPGLAVLAGPAHWPVIPLHLLFAACSSLVLSTLSALLHGSRRATAAAERLVRLFLARGLVPVLLISPGQDAPNRPLVIGARSLRSPPLVA